MKNLFIISKMTCIHSTFHASLVCVILVIKTRDLMQNTLCHYLNLQRMF